MSNFNFPFSYVKQLSQCLWLCFPLLWFRPNTILLLLLISNLPISSHYFHQMSKCLALKSSAQQCSVKLRDLAQAQQDSTSPWTSVQDSLCLYDFPNRILCSATTVTQWLMSFGNFFFATATLSNCKSCPAFSLFFLLLCSRNFYHSETKCNRTAILTAATLQLCPFNCNFTTMP